MPAAPPMAASVINTLPFQALSPEQNRAAEVGTKWELFDRHCW